MREMKDSGVEWIGEIPKNKQALRNKYMLSYEKGKLPSSTNLDKKGFAYIGASDLDSNTNEYSTYTEDDTLPNAEYGDLLVLWDGARAGLCGTHKTGKISSTIVRIRADETVYQPFLYWYYNGFEKFMYQSVNGTTIPHMNRKYIEDIGFINWTIQEQQKISVYLDDKCTKIDDIIAKQQKIIEKLKEYKLSLINEYTVETNGTTCSLRYVGDMKNGLNYSENLDGEIFKILGVGDFKEYFILDKEEMFSSFLSNGKISEDYLLKNGDIVFVRSNGSKDQVGRSVMVENITFPLTYSGFCIRFRNRRCDIIDSKYLLYFFRSYYFRKQLEKYSRGSNINNMNQELLSQFKITFPKFEEQQQIADYLDKKCTAIDLTIEKKQAIIEKLTEYKKSLIYEVVTGKKEVYTPQKTIAVLCPIGIPTNETEYAKMLLIQKIITRCGKNLKGRIHLMKIFHALELEIGFSFHSEYTRYFHGPYDRNIEKYESELVRKGWIRLKKGEKVEYIVVNSTAYKTDYNRIFAKHNKEINRIIDFFKPMKHTSKAEKVATLLASWNDFLIDGITEPTDDMIITDVMTNWTENKRKIGYSTWQAILSQMKTAKIVPHGNGRHTIRMED